MSSVLGLRKVLGPHLCKRPPEALEGTPDTCRILGRGPHPDIDVKRGPHIAMRRQRVGPDHEVFNALVA